MTYPLPKNKIKDFANKFSKVYVIEENDDFLYDEIKKIDGINSKILKKDDEYKVNELTVDRVKEIIFNRNTVGEKIDNLPPRPPQFCPGCPHRATFYLLNRYRKTVSGDIGCYGLGVLPPFKAMDTILCMGASVTMGHGFNVAGENSVSVIGDSTFFHTGINGLINTFYNKGKGLIIILDNSITAMTGGQINPSSRTKNTVYVDIEKIVKSIGIEYVKTIDSYDMKTIEREIRDAKEIDELRVLIVKNPCAMMLKEPIGKIQRINQNKCVKCKMCLKVGCPAITFKDNVMEINPQLCIGCTVCTQVCPKGAIEDDERY
jgi:indolepyruvate ferredoxin oxidoreductase alpha subunit